MGAVESTSVPSQSKTTRLNRRVATSRIGHGLHRRIEARDEARKVLRQRGHESHWYFRERMRKSERMRMQEHPLQPFLGQRLVPREVAVLVVAGQRKAQVRQMHA